MIEVVVPYFRVNDGERSESTGITDDELMLCMNPRQCPTSCAST